MNWIKFTTWLLGIYTCYYAILIFWDYFRTKGTVNADEKPELVFAGDDEQIHVVGDETGTAIPGSPVISSGGVSLKDLFNLARDESIEYIKAVSF